MLAGNSKASTIIKIFIIKKDEKDFTFVEGNQILMAQKLVQFSEMKINLDLVSELLYGKEQQQQQVEREVIKPKSWFEYLFDWMFSFFSSNQNVEKKQEEFYSAKLQADMNCTVHLCTPALGFAFAAGTTGKRQSFNEFFFT